jgi:hypothetical protein
MIKREKKKGKDNERDLPETDSEVVKGWGKDTFHELTSASGQIQNEWHVCNGCVANDIKEEMKW